MESQYNETELSFLSDDEVEKILYKRFLEKQTNKAFLLEQKQKDLIEIADLDLSATLVNDRIETLDSDSPQQNKPIQVICRRWNTSPIKR